MGKFLQLRSELWPLIDVILCIYIELIFRGGVSCLPAGLLFSMFFRNAPNQTTVFSLLHPLDEVAPVITKTGK